MILGERIYDRSGLAAPIFFISLFQNTCYSQFKLFRFLSCLAKCLKRLETALVVLKAGFWGAI
jgi:hypothetical protein